MPNDARYCPICGNAVSNPCMPRSIRNHDLSHLLDLSEVGSVHLNPPGAHYCLTCGAPTVYKEAETDASLYHYLLSRGMDPETDVQGGLPTVKYGPNIPVDEKNGQYRVRICPVCLNETIEQDAEYCIICGTSLTNICDGIESEYDGELYRHSNPANARFCYCCGKPTAYSRLPILPSYKDALRRMTEKATISRDLAEMDIDEDLFWKMQQNNDDDGNLPF